MDERLTCCVELWILLTENEALGSVLFQAKWGTGVDALRSEKDCCNTLGQECHMEWGHTCSEGSN